jgi:hypothetical protein
MEEEVQQQTAQGKEVIHPEVAINPWFRSRKLRRGILWFILALELLIFIWLLPHDLLAYKNIQFLTHPRQSLVTAPDLAAKMKQDPGLGWKLSISTRNKQSIGENKKGYLLVFVGDCASCLHADLKTWGAEAKRKQMSMVLLTSATRSKASEFERSLDISAPIISETNGNTIKRINAFWAGRAYLFSPRWRLMWLSKQPDFPVDPFSQKGFQTAIDSRGIR